MLSLYRRHLKSCPHRSMTYRRCRCPIWVVGTLRGTFMRKSLDLRNWENAQSTVREWESEHAEIEKHDVETAGTKFVQDAESRNLAGETLNKYRLLFAEMTEYFGKKELKYISVDDLARYRATWKLAPITSQKKLERLRAFFKFCKSRGWIKDNRAVLLKTPKITMKPTLPFTGAQWERVLWATEVYPIKGIYGKNSRERIRTFVMVLRYTGLRIRDVVRLKKEQVNDGTILLYTQKTGQPVYIPIPPKLGALLDQTGADPYFFWSGLGNEKSCVGDWQRSLRKLFKLAGVKGHAHMFRATLAVDLLNNGVPLETVAVLLGNSLKVAEKHYAPYVKSRQENLEAVIKKTFAADFLI
jgi:integrase/recombinase XerD